MVSVDDAVVARISRSGMNFEIMVDPEKALEMKRGGDVGIESILAVNDVFKDSRKGERHNEEDLHKTFGTTDVLEIAKKIILEGEIQFTTEQRRKFVESRKKEIANIIARQGIDPKSKKPHPPQRILNAIEEAQVSVEPFRPAKEQVKKVLEGIVEILPISLERMEIAIKIPIQYAGKASSVVREMAEVKKEDWSTDFWMAVIEIPAGIQGDVYDRLNGLTEGKVDIKIIKEHKI